MHQERGFDIQAATGKEVWMTLDYWFMLPVAVIFATVGTATGVGGASFFAPFFILALGIPPEVAVAMALVTEVFGFASGLYSYAHKRLVDYRLGKMLLLGTIPAALIGVWLSSLMEPEILKAILGVGLFAVAANALRTPDAERVALLDEEIEHKYGRDKGETRLSTAEGEEISYTVCNRTEGLLIAALGGLFKGMIATGLGELDDDFLLERCRVPSRVSVATGVFVVLCTTLAASLGHLVKFWLAGGHGWTTALSLLVFTIPGVILGGQLGPWLMSRMPQRTFERGLHVLLLVVAALTFVEALL
jgi:uncharacterized membrane protein YfcA